MPARFDSLGAIRGCNLMTASPHALCVRVGVFLDKQDERDSPLMVRGFHSGIDYLVFVYPYYYVKLLNRLNFNLSP